jgi:hypothetical protein
MVGDDLACLVISGPNFKIFSRHIILVVGASLIACLLALCREAGECI